MRDRAAARADLHHLDHRDAQRQAGAFQETRRAVHFVDARRIRLEILDQADLRRGAAHVERQHLLLGAARRDLAGEDRAARGPGLDQPHRKLRAVSIEVSPPPDVTR